jgi:hypothetical protein
VYRTGEDLLAKYGEKNERLASDADTNVKSKLISDVTD